MGLPKNSITKLEPALERVKRELEGYFEPQLQKLGLGEDSIRNQSLDELNHSLDTVTDAISHPESFGVFRITTKAEGHIPLISSISPEFHFQSDILPILLERKKLIIERITRLKGGDEIAALRSQASEVEKQSSKEQIKTAVQAALALQDPTKLSIGQWIQKLTPVQFWGLLTALLAAGVSLFGAGVWTTSSTKDLQITTAKAELAQVRAQEEGKRNDLKTELNQAKQNVAKVRTEGQDERKKLSQSLTELSREKEVAERQRDDAQQIVAEKDMILTSLLQRRTTADQGNVTGEKASLLTVEPEELNAQLRGRSGSANADETFEREFQGHLVNWKGTLKFKAESEERVSLVFATRDGIHLFTSVPEKAWNRVPTMNTGDEATITGTLSSWHADRAFFLDGRHISKGDE